ncbi:MAG: hypothetical protein N2Z40_02775 [Caldimicrobium sp.]|nr:hypothetical protein [Caldimicrobium sp.]MCX7613131.1 hypothetical protein [Caldimicrobium sp.]MDW8183262.1 hypothetical protein [Caldimicrobium sp.]
MQAEVIEALFDLCYALMKVDDFNELKAYVAEVAKLKKERERKIN